MRRLNMENSNSVDNPVISTQLSTGTSETGLPLMSLKVLLIFAKEPVNGQVKTRLTPDLTQAQAATLYAFSQGETVAKLSDESYQTVICYSGDKNYFQQRYPSFPLITQGSGDLGQRLQRMFRYHFDNHVQKVCVVGTDSPDLPPAWVLDAFDQLDHSDAVTIPALDGGYVLFGARRECSPLFTDIGWSSAEVLEQTRQRAKDCGYSYRELYQWQDIDDLSSLRAFVQRSSTTLTARYAQRCLRSQCED